MGVEAKSDIKHMVNVNSLKFQTRDFTQGTKVPLVRS